ncbi:MAG: hypothetical protein D6814_03810, partial [Calditrichaeota bacterium]
VPNRKGQPAAFYKLTCIDGPVFDVEEIELEWST